MRDTIVVGGGILGLAVAYHLVRGGASVTLVDDAQEGRATDAGAGILSGEATASENEDFVKLALPSGAYYPRYIEMLHEDQAEDTGFAAPGMLVVELEGDGERYRHLRDVILDRQRAHGAPPADELHEVSGSRARQMFPALGDVHHALLHTKAARVDGRLLAAATLRAAQRRGLLVKKGRALGLEVSAGRVSGVRLEGETLTANTVVIAGGAWSPPLTAPLGLDLDIQPQRGQILHLKLHGADTSTWPILEGMRGQYMVPWPDGRVVCGATREHGSGFVPRLTAAGVCEVLSEALRVAPGLAAADIVDMRVGLRPFAMRGLPYLGRVNQIAGLSLCCGHGPSGLLLGPYSGKLVADEILGHEAPLDLDPYRAEPDAAAYEN